MKEEGKLRLVEAPPLIEIKNLTKTFETVTALDDVSLTVPEGRIIGLLGPNGGGKTTLLKILAGLCCDYRGEVKVCGHRPGAVTKAQVSYMPDKIGVPETLMVGEIIKIYRTFFEDFDEEQCREMLDIFEIKETDTAKEMSKGVIDKLQVSLLMSRKAKLYLLDEPIAGVDIEARDHVLDVILERFTPKSTMIIVTHMVREIERLFDSVIVLKKGKIGAFEESDAIRMRYGSLEEGLKEIFRGEK